MPGKTGSQDALLNLGRSPVLSFLCPGRHSAACVAALTTTLNCWHRGHTSDPSFWVAKDSSKPSLASIIFLNSMLDKNKGCPNPQALPQDENITVECSSVRLFAGGGGGICSCAFNLLISH